MRKWLLVVALLPVSAWCQVSNPSIISVTSAPSGACTAGLPNQQVVSTGTQYSCQAGTWGAIGGGGGSGTVTSVSVTSANGVSGSVATATTTPAITLTLGAINPSSTGLTTPGTGAFTTTTAKVIDGTSYSNLYSGSTLDVRVNACLADAAALTNGNTSGICDSSGDGGTQTIAGQIIVPTSSTWVLPGNCTWNITSSGGSTNAAIFQDYNSVIRGPGFSPHGCDVINLSGNNAIAALYENNSSVSAYFYMRGMNFYNTTYTVASGDAFIIQQGDDNSTWERLGIYQYEAGQTGILLQTLCCAATLRDVQVNMQYTGGIALDVESSGTSQVNGVVFENISLAHSGSGYAELQCDDTSSGHFSSMTLKGWYLEVNKDQNSTVPMVINGCGTVNVNGLTINNISSTGGSTVAGMTVSNAAHTALSVAGWNMTDGFAYPATAITNNDTGIPTITDAAGRLQLLGDTNQVLLHGSTSGVSTLTPGAVAGSVAAGNYTRLNSSLSVPVNGRYSFGTTSQGDEWWDSSGSGTEIDAAIGGNLVFTLLNTGPEIRPSYPLGFFTSGFSIDAGLSHDSTASTIDVGANQTAGNTGGSMKMTNSTQLGINSSAKFATATNCSAVGTSASPSLVACTAAAAGAFSCATTASAATCVVSTTAVTANSQIFVQEVADEGTRLGVTCNTAPTVSPAILLASKSTATSFTINMPTITVNPACFDYYIVN